MIGLRSETDDEPAAFGPRGFGQNIRRGLEANRQRLLASLHFFGLRFGGAIVGDGRSENRGGGSRKIFDDGTAHFFGGSNDDTLDAWRRLQIYGTANENYFRATTGCGFRDGVAHFPGRAIRQIAHGVKVFAGRPGSDQNGLTLQILLGVERLANRRDDFLLSGEAAGAGHSTCKIAFIRVDDFHAARPQLFDVFLGRGVVPHVDVHGRGNNYGGGGGQIKRGEKIVGDAAGEFRENVRGRRGHEEQIRALSHGDVLDGAFEIGL